MSTLIIGTLLLAFLIFIYPFLDIKYTKTLKTKRDSASRVRYFKFVIYSEWLVVAILLIFVLLSSTTLKDIGLTLPDQNASQVYGMIFGFLLGLSVLIFILMKLPFYKKWLDMQVSDIDYLLPTTKLDRNWSILAAITAGICEEMIYRGFVIHYLSYLPFEMSTLQIMILSAVIFGFAHIYQGWKGFILTGLLGFVFARTYIESGSLLFPILLHIVIDMRAFLFTKKLPKENKTSINSSI